MKQQEAVKILNENTSLLHDALNWLIRSYTICQKIGVKVEYSEDEFDDMETLSSRFARVTDIVSQKLFRSIDQVELEDKGTLLDAVNRAHQRGLIESVDKMREIRELRNQIVHEYVKADLQNVFIDILEFTPILIKICNNIFEYCKKY
ncbi:MAG: HepT-like ribonuclease domain-containing protein [Ignavibacteriaceae bacterium]